MNNVQRAALLSFSTFVTVVSFAVLLKQYEDSSRGACVPICERRGGIDHVDARFVDHSCVCKDFPKLVERYEP